MTAEVLKYTMEQVEALELAPGTSTKSSKAGFPSSPATKICARPSRKPSTIAATSPSRSSPASALKPTSSTAKPAPRSPIPLCSTSLPSRNEKRKVSYAEIARLEFTGKDRAAGKHWEDWVKAYNEKKAAGEKNIALVPEALT